MVENEVDRFILRPWQPPTPRSAPLRKPSRGCVNRSGHRVLNISCEGRLARNGLVRLDNLVEFFVLLLLFSLHPAPPPNLHDVTRCGLSVLRRGVGYAVWYTEGGGNYHAQHREGKEDSLNHRQRDIVPGCHTDRRWLHVNEHAQGQKCTRLSDDSEPDVLEVPDWN
jgi:hypothetical protein